MFEGRGAGPGALGIGVLTRLRPGGANVSATPGLCAPISARTAPTSGLRGRPPAPRSSVAPCPSEGAPEALLVRGVPAREAVVALQGLADRRQEREPSAKLSRGLSFSQHKAGPMNYDRDMSCCSRECLQMARARRWRHSGGCRSDSTCVFAPWGGADDIEGFRERGGRAFATFWGAPPLRRSPGIFGSGISDFLFGSTPIGCSHAMGCGHTRRCGQPHATRPHHWPRPLIWPRPPHGLRPPRGLLPSRGPRPPHALRAPHGLRLSHRLRPPHALWPPHGGAGYVCACHT